MIKIGHGLLKAILECAGGNFGFTIAHTEGDGLSWPKLGLGFLVRVGAGYVILTATTKNYSEPLSVEYSPITGDPLVVVDHFITTTAEKIGITPEELITGLKEKAIPTGKVWHFLGVIKTTNDKKETAIEFVTEDNRWVWMPLWGRIVEAMYRLSWMRPLNPPSLSLEDFNTLYQKLVNEATNGQIVLNR